MMVDSEWTFRVLPKAKGHTISNPIEQQSLTFLAKGTGFVEGHFSTDRVGGDGLGMIQAQYTY